MDCAICLNHIQRTQEAYLYPCCHFFCTKCIKEWTERQRRHPEDQECPPQQRCTCACPLCKAPYSYVVFECIGNSFRLIPTCGQPKTMSAMPLSADQSRRRALYVTPLELAPAQQVPIAKRPRAPLDKECKAFVQRELQAVLLTEDVDIIVQHVTGMLQSLVKRHTQPQAGKASSSATLYGDKAGFLAQMSSSLKGFLDQHSEQLAEQLWSFLHSGLSVAAYDKVVFGPDPEPGEFDSSAAAVEHDGGGAEEDEPAAGREW